MYPKIHGSVGVLYSTYKENVRNRLLNLAGLKIKLAQVSYDGGVTFKRVQLVDHSLDNGTVKIPFVLPPSHLLFFLLQMHL